MFTITIMHLFVIPFADSVRQSLKEAKRLLFIDIQEALNTTLFSSHEINDLFDYLTQFSITPDLCPLQWRVREVVKEVLLTSIVNTVLNRDGDSEIDPDSIDAEQVACFQNISSPYVADYTAEIVSNIQKFLLDYDVYIRSIQLASEVISVVKRHQFSSSCVTALTRMKHCAFCGGYIKFPPCLNLCLNTIRGCFADVSEIFDDFSNFSTSFKDLSRDIDSSLNPDAIVTNLLKRFVTMIPEFRRQSSLEYLVSLEMS